MQTTDKSKTQLANEITELHQRIAELEKNQNNRHQTAEKLKKSEQNHRRLFEQSIDGIIVAVDGRLVRTNQAFCALHGLPAEKLIGKNPLDFIHPDHREMAQRRITALLRLEALTDSAQYKALRADGTELWVEVRSRPFTWEGKAAFQTIIRDVTERRLTEKALRQSEEKYRLLVKNVPAIICKGFKDWSIEFVDKKIEQLTGYPMEAFNSRNIKWCDLIVEEDFESAKQAFIRALKTDKSYIREYRIKSKNEKNVWIQERGQIICDENGEIEYVSGVFFDITQRKETEKEKHRLELQLRHAQKMEAVGTLAGGVAHDFNNLLQAVQGYAELLLMNQIKTDPDYQKLKEIIRIAERGSELTRQMLTFGRKVESHKQPLNLNHVIENAKNLLMRTIPKMIAIELHLEPDLKTAEFDPFQIEQVLMNLGVNARDAMPEGGKLSISTQNVFLDEAYCRKHLGTKPGEYVLLCVSDTGSGIDQNTLEHIYEPFFTSKEVGKGTGLGLAMVYGIVKNHDGYIVCTSEPGKGTAFRLYLPAVKQKPKLAAAEEAEVPIKGGNEIILLADDEEFILDFGKQFLEKYGYTVLTAADGESALAQYREHEHIDLVILDLIMPGMGGRKCLENLLKIDPRVKVLIASGYSFNGPMTEAVEAGATGFISKPYNVEKMLKTIRDVLQLD
ncbi:MAG: PAS domain S-box protein [Proteobacteria bacterium]|nr:PAS domain S-box protein [Pseudomonadota bacterium]